MQDQSVKSVYRNVVHKCVIFSVRSNDIILVALPEAHCYDGIAATDFTKFIFSIINYIASKVLYKGYGLTVSYPTKVSYINYMAS